MAPAREQQAQKLERLLLEQKREQDEKEAAAVKLRDQRHVEGLEEQLAEKQAEPNEQDAATKARSMEERFPKPEKLIIAQQQQAILAEPSHKRLSSSSDTGIVGGSGSVSINGKVTRTSLRSRLSARHRRRLRE